MSATITTRNENPLTPKQAAPPQRRERDAGEQRAEDARQVELDGVERDRVRQVLLLDERGNQRLIRGPAERLPQPRDEREQQHVAPGPRPR